MKRVLVGCGVWCERGGRAEQRGGERKSEERVKMKHEKENGKKGKK
jgi:hypothetical protein